MILEAFSKTLQQPENQGRVPERVLYDWLTEILLEPPAPSDHVAQVIHAEIEMIETQIGSQPLHTSFEGRSESGDRLLVSLFNFCRSFDNWQFSRWLHHVNASDFCRPF